MSLSKGEGQGQGIGESDRGSAMAGGDAPPVSGLHRRGLVLGISAAAVAAGVGVAWWGRRPRADAGGAEALWALNAPRPDGSPFAMADLKGQPTLVNFWATWCPPCVEELPLIDAFYRQQKANGWQVVALALDKAAAVQAFLVKLPVEMPVALVGMGGMSLLRPLGNVGGSLPFTVVLNPGGEVHARKIGQITTSDLQQWTQEVKRPAS